MSNLRDKIIDLLLHEIDCEGGGISRAADAIIELIRTPTDRMVRAGEAWRDHCSDADTMWTEMVSAALYPEDYAGTDEPFRG
jgi:hypothetical protein